MAKKISASAADPVAAPVKARKTPAAAEESASPERGSPSRSTSGIANVTGKSPRARSGEAAAGQETRAPDGGRLPRPSALLDTRVIYCGDNLEQPEQMQNEKGRMIKPAHSPILHSSFILLNFPVPASHYVKVMLDQIFGENNFQKN